MSPALLIPLLLAAAGSAGGASPRPLDIDAERLVIQGKTNRAVFEGAVTVRRDDWTLTCDRLSVTYDPSGRVKRLVATGSVRVVQGSRIVTADRAEFDNVREVLTLTGHPVITQEGNVVRGEVVVYDLARDEVRVEKVEATIEASQLGTLEERTP